jgi:hypothetical protein
VPSQAFSCSHLYSFVVKCIHLFPMYAIALWKRSCISPRWTKLPSDAEGLVWHLRNGNKHANISPGPLQIIEFLLFVPLKNHTSLILNYTHLQYIILSFSLQMSGCSFLQMLYMKYHEITLRGPASCGACCNDPKGGAVAWWAHFNSFRKRHTAAIAAIDSAPRTA